MIIEEDNYFSCSLGETVVDVYFRRTESVLKMKHHKKRLLVDIRGLGKNPWGGVCLYLYLISFDFDSGVGIPCNVNFLAWGVTP